MSTDPYASLTDAEVLDRARRALLKAAELAPGSVERELQWACWESAKAELDLRVARSILDALVREGRLGR
jgi:hypothetical protein